MLRNLVVLSLAFFLFEAATSAQALTCGTSTVTFSYNGISVTYGTVANVATGRCWLDRNLGATQVATSSTDAASYGDLFQWGRGADGHQLRASTPTITASTTDNPGHGFFITSTGNDWRNPSNPNLWQGVNGINNACPSGWRVPTKEEWEAEVGSWTSQNAAGAFASTLKLTLAGRRPSSIDLLGTGARYWSSTGSTLTSTSSFRLEFNTGEAEVGTGARATGASVRCIYDCRTSAGTLSGNQTICIGATSTFSSTANGGTWSSSSLGIATVDASTGVVTGISGGTTTITYTIAGTVSCATVSAARTITVLAAPTFNTTSITLCPNATYRLSLTTASPNANGWSSTGGGLSVSDGYVTAGSATGTGTINYTDGCGTTIGATVNISMIPGTRSLELDRVGAHRFNGSAQGPVISGITINYAGYGGFNYYSQSRPFEVGFYRANVQSGSAAGCPCQYYIFNCTTCDPSDNEPLYSADGIQIGSQIWMAENLNVSTYRNGDPIGEVTDNGSWAVTINGAWSWLGNNAANGSTYGRLYNWYAVNDSRGLCPAGWHVPTRAEWETLAVNLGGSVFPTAPNGVIPDVGTKLKSAGTSLWGGSNIATNESGFSGLPGGYRSAGGGFILGQGWWWSSSGTDGGNAYGVNLVSDLTRLEFNIFYSKISGFSVRCIKD